MSRSSSLVTFLPINAFYNGLGLFKSLVVANPATHYCSRITYVAHVKRTKSPASLSHGYWLSAPSVHYLSTSESQANSQRHVNISGDFEFPSFGQARVSAA